MTDDNEMTYTNPQGITLKAGLYLVPTPIGNLRDITLRGLDVLRHCDAVICEDSRVTGKLLAAYDIRDKRKIVYNDHSTEKDRATIIAKLSEGAVLAFVSDAGTPMISDPGYKLAKACMDEDLYVTALPGASAVLPAIQLSGLPSDGFLFAGFLPSKEKALTDFLRSYQSSSETLVFYESAKRLDKTLAVMADILGDRQAAIVREISKLYEESIRGSLVALADDQKNAQLKGEVVLVIAGRSADTKVEDIDELIRQCLRQGMSVKDAVATVTDATDARKKDVYHKALAIQGDLNA